MQYELDIFSIIKKIIFKIYVFFKIFKKKHNFYIKTIKNSLYFICLKENFLAFLKIFYKRIVFRFYKICYFYPFYERKKEY